MYFLLLFANRWEIEIKFFNTVNLWLSKDIIVLVLIRCIIKIWHFYLNLGFLVFIIIVFDIIYRSFCQRWIETEASLYFNLHLIEILRFLFNCLNWCLFDFCFSLYFVNQIFQFLILNLVDFSNFNVLFKFDCEFLKIIFWFWFQRFSTSWCYWTRQLILIVYNYFTYFVKSLSKIRFKPNKYLFILILKVFQHFVFSFDERFLNPIFGRRIYRFNWIRIIWVSIK